MVKVSKKTTITNNFQPARAMVTHRHSLHDLIPPQEHQFLCTGNIIRTTTALAVKPASVKIDIPKVLPGRPISSRRNIKLHEIKQIEHSWIRQRLLPWEFCLTKQSTL
jgi:hypothetical protein